jgi:hypothetical protein
MEPLEQLMHGTTGLKANVPALHTAHCMFPLIGAT